ncbi:uncharacterized protein LOC106881710 isoform X2 [Octopus bimaculoides]|nr:uncharacterized protein LOC106881710 isoform X2 [Octopus bimaculoides]|eukprot:XP_014787670.1 PREDICTED: uncharacterized protein LOC106881710 isoform X2 [Octopus bimaculoides]
MSYENMCTLTFFMNKYYEGLKTIYLIDNILTSESLQRFIKYLPVCTSLTEVCLDYNDVSYTDCKYLSNCLSNNITLTSLSLGYCNLPKETGFYLGKILATTAVSSLYVNGNNLQGDGIMEMIKTCAKQAEFDFAQKMVLTKTASVKPTTTKDSATKKDKQKKKKAKKKTTTPLPKAGPWVVKLHAADNGFQLQNPGGGANVIDCMQHIRKLIVFSEYLRELNLYGNHIGNLGSQMLLESLQARQKAKLPPLKMRSSYRIRLPNIYMPLLKLSTGNPNLRKKKKSKSKKK